MTAQLPDYLQKAALPRLADRATEGMGSAMPPHISIRGSNFTLIDAAGEKHPVETKYLDVCIFDLSDKMCKLLYDPEKPWTPESNDPPLCWSSNGIAASREATEPQNAAGGHMCNSCEWNKRGSAQSKLTGKPVKACRDELWAAVFVLDLPNPKEAKWVLMHKIAFQFRVTPGSFDNWKKYKEKFGKTGADMRDVVTRLTFEADKSGVVQFAASSYFIDPEAGALRNEMLLSHATDGIVGRLDQPIQGALVAPQQTAERLAAQTGPGTGLAGNAMPSEQPKTRGRPKKEAAPAAPENGQTTMAPFRPEAAPNFGIQQPEAPPADLANDLDAFFKS
jgi:hypothetical protein